MMKVGKKLLKREIKELQEKLPEIPMCKCKKKELKDDEEDVCPYCHNRDIYNNNEKGE